MMSPNQKYQELIASGEFTPDPQQANIIAMFDAVFQNVVPRMVQKNILRKIFSVRQEPVNGLYLWGGVGVGKTWMMDIFYHCLPEQGKMRLHFHKFMQQIHKKLKQLQHKPNPLEMIAKQIADGCKVICFDEFFVSDIADAMLLGNLFSALFVRGVTLVTTSNVSPNDLYRDGISRDRFIPAIELIKSHTRVIHVGTTHDYRLRQLQDAGIYLTPPGEESRQKMRQYFDQLADSNWVENELLIIAGRAIQTIRKSHGVVWFRFDEICAVPRSQVDYIEISKSFHTVLLSGVPKLTMFQTNAAIYLISLVDVFYDAKVKLIISAECPIDEIYLQGDMKFEFERTKSRLYEMQSCEYLQLPHQY